MKYIKSLTSILLLTCAFLSSGCTPKTFGIPTTEWNQLSPSERQVVMQQYYQHKQQKEAAQAQVDAINAQNAPLTDAISALEATIPSKTNTSSSSVTNTSTQCNGNSCQTNSNSHGSSTSFSAPF